ncbi:MAG TPA: MATE family efflux transporter, partial [Rhizobiaceae bacterium]|nr:MATE family efflux transporter [Rhizobiaceae bacterium]
MTQPLDRISGRESSPAPWSHHARATLALGLPLVGAQLAQLAIHTTDTVLLGWLGAEPLAASVLATQAFFILYIFGAGFAHAAVPLAAQALARGDRRGVRRSVRMGLWVLTLLAALALAPLSQLERLLLSLGQEPILAEMAGRYARIAMWGMFPALGILGLRAFFTAIEQAGIVLWATLAGLISNAFLAWGLIFGNFGLPALGLEGAAIASVASTLVMFAVMLAAALQARFREYELLVRLWRPDWPAFFEVVRLGAPIAVTLLAEVALFAAASVMIGWFGAIQLAAHGIALQLASITFMIPLGLSNAATVRAGIAHGRGEVANLRRGAKTVTAMALAISFLTALLFWFAPEPLVWLFLDAANADSAAVVAVAVPFLAVAAAFQMVDALQAIGAGLLRGLKDTRVPMLLALFSYWPIGM